MEMQLLTYYMAGRGVDVMMPLIDTCEGSRFGEEMDVEMQLLTYYMAGRGDAAVDGLESVHTYLLVVCMMCIL